MAIIDLRRDDGADKLSDTLLRVMLAKQQQDVQKEQLKLRKAELEQQAKEQDYKQQTENGPRMADQNVLLQALAQAQSPIFGELNPTMFGTQQAAPAQPSPQVQVAQQYQQATQGMAPQEALAAAPTFRQKYEQQKQVSDFQKLYKRARPLLTPEEIDGAESAIALMVQGAPESAWKDLMPKTAQEKLAMEKLTIEVAGMKDEVEADKAATRGLIAMGRLPADSPYYKGAAKDLVSERNTIAAEARAAVRARQEQQREMFKSNIAGLALQYRSMGLKPEQIVGRLKQSAPEMGSGELTALALSAEKQYREAYGANTDAAANARALAAISAPAMRVIRGMATGEDKLDQAELWELKVAQGMSAKQATDYVAGSKREKATAMRGQGANAFPEMIEGAGGALGSIPYIGALPEFAAYTLAENLRGKNAQLFNGATETLIGADLRLKSGANATEAEIRRQARQMAPSSGLGPEENARRILQLDNIHRGILQRGGLREEDVLTYSPSNPYAALNQRFDAVTNR